MTPDHHVISDFLDGEAFDPHALGVALTDPAGRDLLIDFIVLRYAAQADDTVTSSSSPARQSTGRLFLAAAAVLVALAGGYEFGQRQAGADSAGPPAATRVVQVQWQRVTEEGAQK
jgi:hypothetical protein